jgi:prephenate dehydrogenase
MSFSRVAIIGADPISVSLALALKAQPSAPDIVGYDPNPLPAQLAREKGAFDRAERRLERAVPKDADLVIVAVPLAVLRDTLSALASCLPAGCLVIDTARLKAPVMAWAAELLPAAVPFVGAHVLPDPARVGLEPLSSIDDASAGYLKGALLCFTPPAGAAAQVIDRLTELALLLEAQPFFVDVTEHDGLQAGVAELPELLAAALTLSTIDSPGWEEMRKFAGARFASATAPDEDSASARRALFLNRENVALRLNGLLSELIPLRELLTRGDAEALERALATAAEGRAVWLEQTRRGMWGREDGPTMDGVPTSGERIGRLFVGERAFERLRGPKGRSRRP